MDELTMEWERLTFQTSSTQTSFTWSKGEKLGGGSGLGSDFSFEEAKKMFSPKQLAAFAAERRLRHNRMCGVKDDSFSSSSSSLSSSIKNKRSHLEFNFSEEVDELQNKRQRPTNQEKEEEEEKFWECECCTFHNRALALQCEVCCSLKPGLSHEPTMWDLAEKTDKNKPIIIPN
jgi:hypothetical protein